MSACLLGAVFAWIFAAVNVQGGNSNTITLQFVNNLKSPGFTFSIRLETSRAFTILELMEQAAWADTTFKYSIAYFASVPGYMLNAVRKDLHEQVQPFVFADVNWDTDHTYWKITINGTPIPVGISACQPKNGDSGFRAGHLGKFR